MSEDIDQSLLIAIGAVDRSWMCHAKCRGLDPDLFHSERGDHITQKQALLICNGDQRERLIRGVGIVLIGEPPCPVIQDCLEFALSLPASKDQHGVYGGLSHKQRVLLRRKRGGQERPKPACGTLAMYRRHLKDREAPCEECRKANAQRKAIDKAERRDE
jgi:hypothetical protein